MTPKFVIVMPTNSYAGGLGMTGNPNNLSANTSASSGYLEGSNGFRPEVVSGGFRVSSAGTSLNNNAIDYRYFAIA